METQFTPAPLFVVDYSGIKDDARIGTIDILTKDRFEPSAKWIAQVMPYGTSRGNFPDHEEAKAYAQLFAAAPDLIEALRLALPYVEGAYECAFPDGDQNENVLILAREAIAKATGKVIPVTNH